MKSAVIRITKPRRLRPWRESLRRPLDHIGAVAGPAGSFAHVDQPGSANTGKAPDDAARSMGEDGGHHLVEHVLGCLEPGCVARLSECRRASPA